MNAIAFAFSFVQLGLFLLLLAGAAHLLLGALWGLRQPPLAPPDTRHLPADADLPALTVQLPLCNERFVAERVVRAACALDWPRDRLEIQILDDSSDDTSALLDGLAAELSRQGHDLRVLRRSDRRGAKAGNLAHGLSQARGEFVAVFDADCEPAPVTLRALMQPLLADPALAFAQGRWCFLNEEASLLTRLQALILHGLMLIEQPRLSAARLPLQFNGSGGIWRACALRDAGGWLGATPSDTSIPGAASITEDLDLSYRARLRGHRGVSLPEIAILTELPASVAAFRIQQRRWVRGAAQVLRGLYHRLGALPAGERLAMLAHLARHLRQPYLVLLTLWLPLTSTGLLTPAFSLGFSWAWVLPLLWIAVALYYGAALRRLGVPMARALLLAPWLLALSLGMSLSLTVSLLQGLFGGPAVFVRTPKTGGKTGGGVVDRAAGGAGYQAPRDALARVEAVVGAAFVALAALLWWRGDGWGALGLCLPAIGYLWYGGGSLVHSAP